MCLFAAVCVTEQRSHSNYDNNREMSCAAVNGERAWRLTSSTSWGWHLTHLDTELCAAMETTSHGITFTDIMTELGAVGVGGIVMGTTSYRSGQSTTDFEDYLDGLGVSIDTNDYSTFAFTYVNQTFPVGSQNSAGSAKGPTYHVKSHLGRLTPGASNDTGLLVSRDTQLYRYLFLKMYLSVFFKSHVI